MTRGRGRHLHRRHPRRRCGTSVTYTSAHPARRHWSGDLSHRSPAPRSCTGERRDRRLRRRLFHRQGLVLHRVRDAATTGLWIRGTPVASTAPSACASDRPLLQRHPVRLHGQAPPTRPRPTRRGRRPHLPHLSSDGPLHRHDPVLSSARWYFNDAGTSRRLARFTSSSPATTPTGSPWKLSARRRASRWRLVPRLLPRQHDPPAGQRRASRFIADDAAGDTPRRAASTTSKVSWYPCVSTTPRVPGRFRRFRHTHSAGHLYFPERLVRLRPAHRLEPLARSIPGHFAFLNTGSPDVEWHGHPCRVP